MKFLPFAALLFVLATSLSSCLREQDPGPLQNDERNYAIQDFDRLEMGNAFVITVTQSPTYAITVRGDRRNLDDLNVTKIGSTLRIDYVNGRSHEHTTFVTIGMPALRGASFSDASSSAVSGFKSDMIDLVLTDASISQFNIESKRCDIILSGASKLTVSGSGDAINAKVSGASELFAYDFTAGVVDADASGASKVNVYASRQLKATASGASVIYYKGAPSVISNTSGSSSIASDN
jgi:hypothetical protein